MLGNHDRFPNSYYKNGNYGNILIKYLGPNQFEVSLIDNSIGRPGRPWFRIDNVPLPEHIPQDLAHAILAFDALTFAQRFRRILPETGIEDVIQRVFAVQMRLRRLPIYGPYLKPISSKGQNKKIGLIFGTLDPLHEGHMELGFEALRRLGFSEVVLIPNHYPAHKAGAKAIAHRNNMAALRVENEAGFNLYAANASEIINGQGGKEAFIRSIQATYQTEQVYTLIGEDAYRDGILAQGIWKNTPAEKFVVFSRGSYRGDLPIPPEMTERVLTFPREDLGLSSTLMRKKLSSGQGLTSEEMRPELVDYAQQFNLYGP
jgi:nicotinic acid mononucleotide adenylyltransferase